MATVNTKTKKKGQLKLALNTATWFFKCDSTEASNLLNQHNIPHYLMNSSEGYWLNVKWKCGITAPLTLQELQQLKEMTMTNKTECPRAAMLRVRKIVANAIKQDLRLDKMSFVGKDRNRLIIALQDYCNAEIDAHKRASDHVRAAKQNQDKIAEFSANFLNTQNARFHDMSDEYEEVKERLHMADKNMTTLQDNLADVQDDLVTALEQNDHLKDQIASLKTTLKMYVEDS